MITSTIKFAAVTKSVGTLANGRILLTRIGYSSLTAAYYGGFVVGHRTFHVRALTARDAMLNAKKLRDIVQRSNGTIRGIRRMAESDAGLILELAKLAYSPGHSIDLWFYRDLVDIPF